MDEHQDILDQEFDILDFQTVVSQTNVVLTTCFPILKILRFLCLLPYHIKHDGRFWFSFYSTTALTTYIGYMYLMSLYCHYFMKKWVEFSDISINDNDTHCYYAVAVVLTIPAVFTPIVYWARMITICQYWNYWLGFQVLYREITGTDLQIAGKIRVYVGIAAISTIHVALFLTMMFIFELPLSTIAVYAHIFAVNNYSIFCWHVICYSIKLVTNEIRICFRRTLAARPTNTNRIKDYQPLWTYLHIMTKNFNGSFGLSLSIYRNAIAMLSLIILLSISLDVTVANSFSIGPFSVTIMLLLWCQLALRLSCHTLQDLIHTGHDDFVDEMRLADESLLTEDENKVKRWLTEMFPLQKIEFITFKDIFRCACFSATIAVLIINLCTSMKRKSINGTFATTEN